MAATTEAKAYKGMGMEGFVARWYAKTTLKDLEEFRRLAGRVAEQTPEGGHVLDLAPGPGYLAMEVARLGRQRVTGLDISTTFVRLATEKAKEAGVTVEFRHGDAAHMPFDEGTFDLVVCRAAFKNFTNPVGAINEIHRVLKAGGKGLIIDLRKDASTQEIKEHIRRMRVGWLNAIFMRLVFRFMLLKRAYTRADVERFAAASKFGRCEWREDAIGFEAWFSK